MICTITSCVGCLVIVIIITGATFGLFVCVVLCHKKKQVNLKLVKLKMLIISYHYCRMRVTLRNV